MQYNTAIARMMELVNALYLFDEKELASDQGRPVLSEVFGKLIPMLSPFIPHVAAELWEVVGNDSPLHDVPWPDYVDALAKRNEIEIVFQVNGKIRCKGQVKADITKQEMQDLAMAHDKMQEYLKNKTIKKVVVVPGKLVNIVLQ
jgi:leucyl-tRNA synthetase